MSLSDARIRAAKPKEKLYKIYDGMGLYIEIHPSGGKRWRFKYSYNGKEKRLSLGTYPEVPLASCKNKVSGVVITGAREKRESYYATELHELIHWTGHESRLKREFGKMFGDPVYANEELVAELGAAFLCASLGITPEIRQDHAAYIGDWLSILKEDSRAIFRAAAHAQRAADYLNGLQPKPPEPEPEGRTTPLVLQATPNLCHFGLAN